MSHTLITEVEELLANAPRNPLFVIPHPEYKAALSRINTNANADWSEFGHVATVSPAWADLFARSPELLRRLVEEVKTLRAQVLPLRQRERKQLATVIEIRGCDKCDLCEGHQ